MLTSNPVSRLFSFIFASDIYPKGKKYWGLSNRQVAVANLLLLPLAIPAVGQAIVETQNEVAEATMEVLNGLSPRTEIANAFVGGAVSSFVVWGPIALVATLLAKRFA